MIAPMETFTVEIDSDVLAQAEKVCADIGITLQDAVNMFVKRRTAKATKRTIFKPPRSKKLVFLQ